MPEQPQQQAVGRTQITTGSIGRSQLNIDFPTQAVIRKIIAGIGIGLASTGVDSGTGDVTVMVTGTFFTENEIALIAEEAVGSVIPGDGWISDVNWIRLSNTAFMQQGNNTTKFRKGIKIRVVDGGGTKYGVVGSSGFTSGTTTTVNLIPTTDYILSGTLSSPYYSPIENPEGFPQFFNFNANPQGFSSVPTSPEYKWTAEGKIIFILYNEPNNGVSNATTFTASAPIIPVSNMAAVAGTLVNNGNLLTTAGRVTMVAGNATIIFRTDMNIGAWTAGSTGKRAVAYWWFEF